MGSGAVRIGGESELEVGFGLWEEALVEGVAAEGGVFGGLLCGGERGHADSAHAGELEGGLAIAGFRVGAANSFDGTEALGVRRWKFGVGGGRFEKALQPKSLVVVGLEFERLTDLVHGGGGVSTTEEGQSKVVVKVFVGGVKGGCSLEQRNGVFALAAEGNALVVDDFGKGKAIGYEGEGGLCCRVVGGVEAGKTEVEAGFQGERIVFRNFAESCRSVGVTAICVLLLAQCKEGWSVVGRDFYGSLKAFEAFRGGGGVSPANVVFEGGQWDSAGRGDEGALGDVEMGVDGASNLPGNGVFGVEEAGKVGGVIDGWRETEIVDREGAGLNVDAVIGYGEAAENDEVCIKLAGDLDGGGAGRTKVGRKAKVVVGVGAIVMRDGEEAGGVEAAVESVGKAVADPVKRGVAGFVFKGEDENDATGGGEGCCVLGAERRGGGARGGDRGDDEEKSSGTFTPGLHWFPL